MRKQRIFRLDAGRVFHALPFHLDLQTCADWREPWPELHMTRSGGKAEARGPVRASSIEVSRSASSSPSRRCRVCQKLTHLLRSTASGLPNSTALLAIHGDGIRPAQPEAGSGRARSPRIPDLLADDQARIVDGRLHQTIQRLRSHSRRIADNGNRFLVSLILAKPSITASFIHRRDATRGLRLLLCNRGGSRFSRPTVNFVQCALMPLVGRD